MVQISVVVPVADAERLPRCLDALGSQTLDPSAYEVLVADNAPSEQTRRITEATPARYLSAPGSGSYAARNAGVREAKGAIVAFTDADCVAPPGWLAVIGSVFDRGDVDVAVGPSYGLNTEPIGQLVQRIDDQRWARMAGDARITYCDTRNLAARRDVLLREPFDETFRHGGDLEWGIRMARRGTRIVITPAMAVGHTNVSTVRDAWRRGVRRGRGVAGLVDKHGDDARISGARSLRLFGVDVKTPVLRTLTHPAIRPLARAALTAVNAVIMGSVATCLAVPVLRPAAPPLTPRFPEVIAVEAPPGLSYYQSKGIGLRRARGDVVTYVDADNWIPPDWLEEITRPFAHDERIAVVLGRMRYRPAFLSRMWDAVWWMHAYDAEGPVDRVYATNSAAFRRAILAEHFYDDPRRYRGFWERTLTDRLLAAGHTLWLNPRAKFTHDFDVSVGYFVRRAMTRGYTLVALRQEYPRRRYWLFTKLRWLMPWIMYPPLLAKDMARILMKTPRLDLAWWEWWKPPLYAVAWMPISVFVLAGMVMASLRLPVVEPP